LRSVVYVTFHCADKVMSPKQAMPIRNEKNDSSVSD